ncbi:MULTISPECIES: hypothetical protein [Burkholderia]|uniref:Uncharacterized protein n=2 Tax=Burkholderiaceae TaxID=119060 RepID=A0ABV2C1G8_9BURK|nr:MULTISPECIES: hypothetical protein [Burkholderia]MBP0605045.1 hypothetical protein [Burkholderia sp. CpTa8-5]QVN16207.1 hypothetical protein JYG37_31090 [Burkholderia sp. LAS2]
MFAEYSFQKSGESRISPVAQYKFGISLKKMCLDISHIDEGMKMSTTTIENAGYGVYNSTIDVTTQVAAAYKNGQRVFTASNQWGDPAPGERKYLYIFWTRNSEWQSGVTGENDSHGVTLP